MVTTPHSPQQSTCSSNNELTKKRKVGVPKFLRYLYQILEKEDNSIIGWANGGSSIQILDTEKMAQYILPKYFKHSKYASFQRQLNYFGFRKWTKSQTNICTFSHNEFRQNRPDRLYLIKRKNSPETTRKQKKTNEKISYQRPNIIPDIFSSTYRIYPTNEYDIKTFKSEQINGMMMMNDIENLNIQSDGPNFHLLDINPLFTPTPLPILQDSKTNDSTSFDFDMNCAWLDNFNPNDSITNAFGQTEYT